MLEITKSLQIFMNHFSVFVYIKNYIQGYVWQPLCNGNLCWWNSSTQWTLFCTIIISYFHWGIRGSEVSYYSLFYPTVISPSCGIAFPQARQ